MKREKGDAPTPLTTAEAGAIQSVSEVETLRRSLEFIAAWDRDKFPRVPDREDPTKTYAYGVAYGSNGERDFMRNIAQSALDATSSPRVFTEAEVRDLLRAKLKATDEYIAMREQSGDREAGGAYSVRTSLVNLAKDLGLTLD